MNTRRAFFLSGGAVAVATTAAVATTTAVAAEVPFSQRDLLDARDREAIRKALAVLFANDGGWQDLSRHRDVINLLGRQRATATVHFEVEECTPLEVDCTAAQMARLQGNVADRRWMARRVEADLMKVEGEWKVSRVRMEPDRPSPPAPSGSA
jgi:hypothetical protein